MIAATPPYLPLENPLWQFSLSFYQQPQVANFLLECQDNNNADVCLLLWASFISVCDQKLSDKSWLMADHALRSRRWAICRLRYVRRLLGKLGLRGSTYTWLKNCELKMEQRQLARLWNLKALHWPKDKPPLQLAAQHYRLPQQVQYLWASLIAAYKDGL
ncbi:MAG: DUF2390 domain-containing protein [Gammaproteobacteria bacterium]|nr:DUF2390 domain-containing protein [Gammaproteobacteria bacterium]